MGEVGAHTFYATVSQLQTQSPVPSRGRGPGGLCSPAGSLEPLAPLPAAPGGAERSFVHSENLGI